MSSPRERLAFSLDETSVDPSARSSITPTQSLDSIVRGRALREALTQGVGHLLPLGMGRLSRVLGEDGPEQGDNGRPLLGGNMSQSVPEPMHAAPLVRGVEDLRGCGPEPLVVIR